LRWYRRGTAGHRVLEVELEVEVEVEVDECSWLRFVFLAPPLPAAGGGAGGGRLVVSWLEVNMSPQNLNKAGEREREPLERAVRESR
jgi:hypothetical protein